MTRQKKVVYIDGYKMRQMLPDLDIINWRNKPGMVTTDFIPPDEIWIDHRYEQETNHLLNVYRIETMRRFTTSSYDKVRKYMKKKLCAPEPIPGFIERTEYHKEQDLTVCYVRGDIVRKYIDPVFIFGGHDLVYTYIPKRTIWIDVQQDPREIKYVYLHEVKERGWMERGNTYDHAHERATDIELMSRARKNIIWPVRKMPYDRKIKPLNVPLFTQSDVACGPASLKMILDFFGRTYRGKSYTEKRLIELCSTTEDGQDHEPLIVGTKKIRGASVFAKANGTIHELRHFVLQERLPVLVGWWSKFGLTPDDPPDEDCGHFSVISHISRNYIYLADPWYDEIEKAGIRKIPIRHFLKMWHDTDTPASLPVKHWYMVVNFEGKTFKIPGGANY